MAATEVSSSIASVLASRASTPSRTELAIISAATSAATACNESKRRPIGQQNSDRSRRKRRQAIEPDRRARLRHAERFAGFHRCRLQPIDADRLLVADLVLKPDVDIFARFQHLLGRLREARFVAVDRRYLEKARAERRAARIPRAARPRADATPTA